MSKNNNKRLLQSPEQSDNTKIVRLIEPTQQESNRLKMDTQSTSVQQNNQNVQLERNDQLLLTEFRNILRTELDIRFATFANAEIAPIKENIQGMKDEIVALKLEVADLKTENACIVGKLSKAEQTISHIDKDAREMNLIFYKVPRTNNAKEAVEEICVNLMKVQGALDIRKCIILKSANGTNNVLTKFGSPNIVNAVLKNARNLKGSNIWVARDMDEEERQCQRVLLKLKKTIEGIDNSKKNKIKVWGKVICIEDLKLTLTLRTNIFGNSKVDGRKFLMETFSIDFDNLLNSCQ